MEDFISKKASVIGALFEGGAVVLGPSEVGEGALVGLGVVIGYPIYSKISRALTAGERDLLGTYDELSEGSKIGSRAVLRSHSVVYERVKIEDGVQTGHGVLIREETQILEGSVVGSHSVIDGGTRVGRRVSIQSGCYLPPGSVVEDDAFLSPFVVVTNDKYPPSRRLVGVHIGSNTVIGANSVLLAGVEIGDHAVVGSGAVVTRDVASGDVVKGVPARRHTSREKYDRSKQEYERGMP